MKTKGHHRPWQQWSIQYPSKVKLCSFGLTQRQGAWSRRSERKIGKVRISLLEMCAGRWQDMQKSSSSSLALFANHIYLFSWTAESLMREKNPNQPTNQTTKVTSFWIHFLKKQKSFRCQYYTNLWSPKWNSFCLRNEESLQFGDLDVLKS